MEFFFNYRERIDFRPLHKDLRLMINNNLELLYFPMSSFSLWLHLHFDLGLNLKKLHWDILWHHDHSIIFWLEWIKNYFSCLYLFFWLFSDSHPIIYAIRYRSGWCDYYSLWTVSSYGFYCTYLNAIHV